MEENENIQNTESSAEKKTWTAENKTAETRKATGLKALTMPQKVAGIALGVAAVAFAAITAVNFSGARASAPKEIIAAETPAYVGMFDFTDKLIDLGIQKAAADKLARTVNVTLEAGSAEEDLEVQIVNDKGELIEGVEFTLTVVSDDGKYSKEWTVDDGYLHLTKIDSGEYTVSIAEKEDYIMPEPITVKVRKKVARQVIDVSDIVVDESSINTATEDASYGSATASSRKISDTVEYVASSSKKVTKEVDVTVTSYSIYGTDADGHLTDKNGNTTKYYPVYENGVISGVYYYTESSGGASAAKASKSFTASFLNFMLLTVYAEGDDGNTETTTTDSSNTDSTPSSESSSSQESSSESTSSESSSSQESSSESASSESSLSQESSSAVSEKVTDSIFNSDGTLKSQYADIIKTTETTEKEEKEVTVYYGWQTLDGSRYYFDKNGDAVKGTQTIQGVTYYFDASGKVSNSLAIDVSKWNSTIDWAKVKRRGVDTVIIRVGYRGYGTGALVQDPTFASNIKGAKAAGLKVGLYFFSQAVSAQEAVEEASLCVEALRATGCGLNLPIYFDSEYSTSAKSGRADGLSKTLRTEIAKAFCTTIQNAGYRAGIYRSKTWFYYQLDYSQLSSYSIWVAHYTTSTDFSYRYDIWQYSGTGHIDGVSTAVDMNIVYRAF